MPPRGVKNPKRKRQYQHIKQSARKRGASLGRAEELAARVVNKQRSEAGETKGTSKRSSKKSASSSRRAKPARATRSAGAKSRGRTSASGKTGRKSSGASSRSR